MGAPMVTTFGRFAGSLTKSLCRLLDKVCRGDISFAEMEHPSLKTHYLTIQGGSLFMFILPFTGPLNWSISKMSEVCLVMAE